MSGPLRNAWAQISKNPPPFRRQDLPRHLWAFGSGVVAGGTIGAVGWGGAQVLIPSLTWSPHPLVPGLPQLAATGVSLVSLSFSTLTTGFQFWKDDHVHVPVALMIGIPAVVSARVGTLWAKKLSGPTLTLIFNIGSIILIPTHFWIQERAKERRHHQEVISWEEKQDSIVPQLDQERPFPTRYDFRDPNVLVPFVSFGFMAGMSSALMGVGGLPLCMSFLTEMTSRIEANENTGNNIINNPQNHFDHHMVQGTAICSVIPSIMTSASSRIHAIPLVTSGVVCVGAAVGGSLGAKLALALDDEDLRTLYMVSLVLFGGRSFYGAAKHLRQLWVARK